jgi:hypothetical protein
MANARKLINRLDQAILVPSGAEDKSLRFLRHEDGMDIYLNVLTGREVNVARR